MAEGAIVITMFQSRVCPYCEIGWPPDEVYQYCPRCREMTIGTVHQPFGPPYNEDKFDFKKERLAAEFEWWAFDNDRL